MKEYSVVLCGYKHMLRKKPKGFEDLQSFKLMRKKKSNNYFKSSIPNEELWILYIFSAYFGLLLLRDNTFGILLYTLRLTERKHQLTNLQLV